MNEHEPGLRSVRREAEVDAGAVLASVGARAVAGVETVRPAATTGLRSGTLERLVDLGEGPVAVQVRIDPHGATATGRAPADALHRLLHRWFGLGDDLAQVRAHLGADPLLGPAVARRPHLRVLGHPDGFEAAVQAVLTQQVSLAAGRTFGARLAAAYGVPGPGGLLGYPTPRALAAAGPAALQEVLRVPRSRAGAVHALAVACADGLELAPGVDAPRVRAALLALPGVGPWTADVVAVRALGDRDAFPAGDLVLRRALGLADARTVAGLAGRWAPHRAAAATHLWAAAGYAD